MKLIEKITQATGIFLATCLVSLSAFAQVKSNFTIHGSFKNIMPVPSKVYLIYAPFLNQSADSAIVKNGQYEFKGYTEEVTNADLSLNPKVNPLEPMSRASVMLDKGELNIVSTDSFHQITVTGSAAKAQNDFNAILEMNKQEIADLGKVMATDRFKTDAEFKKTTQARYSYLILSTLNQLIIFTKKNPASAVSPYITYMLLSSGMVTHAMSDTLSRILPSLNKPTKLRTAIADIVAKQKDQDNAVLLRNKVLDDKIPVGSKAIDFTQPDAAGKTVSLTSFRGKYVLVDFWASWCAPCRAENPNVVIAYNTYKDKGFTIVGISLDGKNTRDAWIAAVKKDNLTWTQLSDLSGWNNEAAKLYGVHAIPQNFLIDPNGNIIGKNLRGEELNKKLASLFN